MASEWPPLPYDRWCATLDTLHCYTQVLGKLATSLSPPQPELQHSALRVTARGWETLPLPAPNGTGSFVVVLDLRAHEAVIEHSDGRGRSLSLVPNRSAKSLTQGVLAEVRALAGPVFFDPKPQETPWSTPLDEDEEHATYDPTGVACYFDAATRAALVLAELRAPYRGRSTPVNAWWGGFDLGVGLFSGRPAAPPSDAFIMRNSMDAEEVAVGWWPGDHRYPRAAFYAYGHPPPASVSDVALEPAAARFDPDLGEYILDWDDIRTAENPAALARSFGQSVILHYTRASGWDDALCESLEGTVPPVY